MKATDWETTLDAFEGRVAAQWASLREGSPDPLPPFEAPAQTTPLPQQLVSRATELVRRCRELEDAVSAALADAQDQLERLEGAGTARSVPAGPVFFDSRV